MDVNNYNFIHDLSSDEDGNDICVSHHYSSNESSSEEEDGKDLEVLLQRTSVKSSCQSQELPDLFEEEMASELDRAMSKLKHLNSNKATESFGSSSGQHSGSKRQYDSVYFDSDEDEQDEEVRNHRSTVSDNELLYDPTMDDKDQDWMDQQKGPMASRASSRRKKDSSGSKKQEKDKKNKKSPGVDTSDAVLNCPGCLTMLCADCQRHSTYSTQYRAMFVHSCRVDYTQLLSFPTKLNKKQIWKNKKKERQMNRRKFRQGGQMEASLMSEENTDKQEEQESLMGTECKATQESSHLGKDASKEISAVEVTVESTKENVAKISSDITEENIDEIQPKVTEEQNSVPTSTIEATSENLSSEKQTSNLMVTTENSSSQKRTVDDAYTKETPKKKVRFLEAETNRENNEESSELEGACNEAVHGAGPTISSLSAEALSSNDTDGFHPVMCQHCNTKVAVLDKDDVYHFFNVITSY